MACGTKKKKKMRQGGGISGKIKKSRQGGGISGKIKKSRQGGGISGKIKKILIFTHLLLNELIPDIVYSIRVFLLLWLFNTYLLYCNI